MFTAANRLSPSIHHLDIKNLPFDHTVKMASSVSYLNFKSLRSNPISISFLNYVDDLAPDKSFFRKFTVYRI